MFISFHKGLAVVGALALLTPIYGGAVYGETEHKTAAHTTDGVVTDFAPLDGLGEMFREIRAAESKSRKAAEKTTLSTGASAGECKDEHARLQPLTYRLKITFGDSDAEAAAAAPAGAQ